MATNLAIDEALLDEALRSSGHATKKATVNEAATSLSCAENKAELSGYSAGLILILITTTNSNVVAIVRVG